MLHTFSKHMSRKVKLSVCFCLFCVLCICCFSKGGDSLVDHIGNSLLAPLYHIYLHLKIGYSNKGRNPGTGFELKTCLCCIVLFLLLLLLFSVCLFDGFFIQLSFQLMTHNVLFHEVYFVYVVSVFDVFPDVSLGKNIPYYFGSGSQVMSLNKKILIQCKSKL